MSDLQVDLMTVESALRSGAIVAHKDGNHGSLYPKVGEFGDEGVPFLTAKLLSDGVVDVAGAPRLPDVHADKLRLGFVEVGDVLLSHNATVGRVAIVPPFDGRLLIGTSLTYFRLNRKVINPRYLAAYFSCELFQSQLRAVMSHTTRNQVPITAQRKLNIAVPPIVVQEGIASLLEAFDSRIGLLREVNATLEAIAQALFKSWFVDFDPVRAKFNGLAPAGLDDAMAPLFPDSLEESTFGFVPKGWKVSALDEVATYLNGLALQKFPPTDDSWLPVIKIAQLRKGDTVGAERAGRNLKPDYIIQNGDVLFSWSGSLEVEVWCGGEGALNQHLFKVSSKDFPKWFYLHWTRHHLASFRQIAASKATTMGHIQRAHLSQAKALVPPAALLNAMSAHFDPLLKRGIENELQAQTLQSLRDTLLPRLISGQLRLPEARAELEEAT